MRTLFAMLAAMLVLGGCNGIPGISYNTVQMPDRPGLDGEYGTEDDVAGNRYSLAKFDNLIGPSVAVLELNGEYVEAWAEPGLIPSVSGGVGIATAGLTQKPDVQNLSLSNDSSSEAGAGAGAISAPNVRITNLNAQQQGQIQLQGQLQGQKQTAPPKNRPPHNRPPDHD